MPSPLKIGLFTRYHSKTTRKVCPEQSAAYPETPERIHADRIRNAGTDRAGTISRRGSRADCITLSRRSRSKQPRIISARTNTALSDRPRRNDSALCSPAITDTDRSRSNWTNNADRISPERSHKTGAVFHGQHCPDFSQLSGQGSVYPVQCSPIAMQ